MKRKTCTSDDAVVELINHEMTRNQFGCEDIENKLGIEFVTKEELLSS